MQADMVSNSEANKGFPVPRGYKAFCPIGRKPCHCGYVYYRNTNFQNPTRTVLKKTISTLKRRFLLGINQSIENICCSAKLSKILSKGETIGLAKKVIFLYRKP